MFLQVTKHGTVEPRHNEGPRDWQNFLRSLQRGSFSVDFLLLGPGKSFIIPRTSLYTGS